MYILITYNIEINDFIIYFYKHNFNSSNLWWKAFGIWIANRWVDRQQILRTQHRNNLPNIYENSFVIFRLLPEWLYFYRFNRHSRIA